MLARAVFEYDPYASGQGLLVPEAGELFRLVGVLGGKGRTVVDAAFLAKEKKKMTRR
jgi:hypothetical protein